MKKIIILIAGMLLLSAPYFVGSTAESHIDKLLITYNENPSVKINKVSYNKGWLSSTAEYEIELLIAPAPNMPDMPTFKISQTLYHGPLLWKHDGLGFGLMDSIETLNLPDDWKKVEDALLFSSRVAFDGSLDSVITLDSVDIDEQGTQVNLMPATGHLQVSSSGHIIFTFDWQGLKAQEEGQGDVEILAVSFESDQQLIKGELYSINALYTGTFKSNVETISINSTYPETSVNLSNFEITADSKAKEDVIDLNIAFKVAEINAVDQKVTDFVYDLSMLNLDIDAMVEFNKLMLDSQQDLQMSPEASMEKLYSNAQAILPKLLAKDPILKINNLGFTVEEGIITSQMTLKVDKDKFQIENPDSLIAALKLDSKGQAPEAFFTKFGLGPTLDALVQQNLITRDGENLKFVFKMIDGKTILNGNPIPLF